MAPRTRHREGEGDLFRRVSVRMHGDAKVRALSRPPPNGETLWHHLLFGEQTGIIPGLCKIGEAAFAEQLGWDVKGFRQAFSQVGDQGLAKADWIARLVFVPNAIKHNKPGNPKVILHWRRAWELLPECELKIEAWHVFESYFKAMPEAWLKAFTKACPKPWLNQVAGSSKQVAVEETKALSTLSTPLTVPEKLALAVQIQSPFDGPSPAEHVEAHYRKVMGKTAGWIFRGTAREQKVNARLKQGYSVEQLCRAIDGCRKSPHHQGQNDTGTVYDDLELICRDAPKVDAFIAIASGKNNSPAAQAASRAATAADRTQQLLANLRNPKPTGEA